MFDFKAIENAIIDDLKPICINNYLILNEINVFPKELVKYIIYYRFEISDEIITLKEDIIYIEKACLVQLLHICFNPYNNIDILSPNYDKYIDMDINDLQHRLKQTSLTEYHLLIKIGVDKIYDLGSNICEILIKRYYDKNNYRRICTEEDIKSCINNMKTAHKYSSLLSIRNDF